MLRYRSVLSAGARKRARTRGETVPREGSATLRALGENVLATLAGRPTRWSGRERPASRTGLTYVPRHLLRNLEVYLARHPSGLSERAARAIRSRISRRKAREWWGFTDSTEATKFGDAEPFAATYGPPKTCPADCAMRGAAPGTPGCDDPEVRACYAGEHNALEQWKSLSKGFTGLPWRQFLRRLRATRTRIVRVNIAGDLPGDASDPSGRHLDARRVFELALAATARRRTAFTYTHYDPTYRDNAAILRRAMRTGFQINLSADSLRDADRKAALGFDVAVVVPRISYWERDASGNRTGRRLLVGPGRGLPGTGLTTPAGRRIFMCPSITTSTARKEAKERARRLAARLGRRLTTVEQAALAPGGRIERIGKTCSTCTPTGPECAKVGRRRIVGFVAHGAAGAEKRLDPARAAEMLLSPTLSPLSKAEVTLAIQRHREAARREAEKRTGLRHLKLANSPRRRTSFYGRSRR